MLGDSRPEYIFIKIAIGALQLIAPLSILYVVWRLLLIPVPTYPDSKWALLHNVLFIYASLEACFFTCVYHPRRYHLQKAAEHPRLTRQERQALFQRCSEYLGSPSSNYPSGWFFDSQSFQKKNVLEWLLWALFSTSLNAPWSQWEDELAGYLHMVENVLGKPLVEGYNEATPCMRVTLDPVLMSHRPLAWYLIVGVMDTVTSIRLYWLGFRHYTDKGVFESFPFRPLVLFSRTSSVQGVSYWYRPHRSFQRNPILFLHGIGIGLYPYASFLADLASYHPDIGILVPEFLSISSRITSPPLSRSATITGLSTVLSTHSLGPIVVVAHSYGTAITAQLLRDPSFSPRISASLLVDPIPFLLHLPDVAYNFVYRAPRTANQWLLWYFASQDPDVARTLSRHFFWAENVLWKEDLEGREVAVALSGRDQVVNAEAVRRYLTGEKVGATDWRRGGLEVLCYPELDHAMIFNTRKRWRRLIRVLDRFVREVN